MKRQHALVAAQVVLLTALILSFQNCSPVNFAADPQNAGLSTGSSPNPDLTVTCPFNGHDYLQGESILAYATSTVPAGQTCASETRVCQNGMFSGSFRYSVCVPGAAQACLFNGKNIAHGQSVTAYASAQVAYGQNCQSQVRTCNNGVLTGSAAYSSCSVGAAPYVPPAPSGPWCSLGSLARHTWECSGQSMSVTAGTGQCACATFDANGQGINCQQVTITSPPYCTDGSTPQNSRVQDNTCSCSY